MLYHHSTPWLSSISSTPIASCVASSAASPPSSSAAARDHNKRKRRMLNSASRTGSSLTGNVSKYLSFGAFKSAGLNRSNGSVPKKTAEENVLTRGEYASGIVNDTLYKNKDCVEGDGVNTRHAQVQRAVATEGCNERLQKHAEQKANLGAFLRRLPQLFGTLLRDVVRVCE
eukprot:363116-Chlamydomonas_euryale.AAC.18